MPIFLRILSKPRGPKLYSRTATATAVATIFSDANSLLGHLFQTSASKGSLAFCTFILLHLSSKLRSDSWLYRGTSSLAMSLQKISQCGFRTDDFQAATRTLWRLWWHNSSPLWQATRRDYSSVEQKCKRLANTPFCIFTIWEHCPSKQLYGSLLASLLKHWSTSVFLQALY